LESSQCPWRITVEDPPGAAPKKTEQYTILLYVSKAIPCKRLGKKGKLDKSMEDSYQGRSPIFYARVAGWIYLIAMALSLFTQMYVPGKVDIPHNVPATAHNLSAFAGLYRTASVVDILIFVSDVVIAWAFYELLKGVERELALLGAFLRVGDAAILTTATLCGVVALRLVSGAEYLEGIDSKELAGLARLAMSVRGAGLFAGFVFLGAGSTVFAFLLFKSRLVLRLLPAWGMLASPLLALGSLGTLLSPWFAANLSMLAMLPMFFYEVPLGLWFVVKGVQVQSQAN
jgi:hypothetical protein